MPFGNISHYLKGEICKEIWKKTIFKKNKYAIYKYIFKFMTVK